MSRNMFGQQARRGNDQLRHPDFGYVIGRVVCKACRRRRELAHVRRYADQTIHLLAPDWPTGKIYAQRRREGSDRKPVPWQDFDLDELRPDAMVSCREHGGRPLTPETIQLLAAGTATHPVTVHI